MDVFTPAQREAHIQTTTQLFRAVQHVHELERGYAFAFPNETEFISQLAEFISMERLCCPFLEFSLQILPEPTPISLSLTGPTGTQEFLRAEFGGAIP
jgi:hypothetical protein